MTLARDVLVQAGERVLSATWRPVERPAAALALAPGAGGRRDGQLLSALGDALAARGVAVLCFDFPYRSEGRAFPDPPAVREACWLAAVAWLRAETGVVPFAGGHSMGGRAASTAAASGMECAGLVLLGYPLYPAGKRGDREAWRDAHLASVRVPMLFVTGTRDALCEQRDLRTVTKRLGQRARVVRVEGADHSFDVPKRSGQSPADVLDGVVEAIAGFLGGGVRA